MEKQYVNDKKWTTNKKLSTDPLDDGNVPMTLIE